MALRHLKADQQVWFWLCLLALVWACADHIDRPERVGRFFLLALPPALGVVRALMRASAAEPASPPQAPEPPQPPGRPRPPGTNGHHRPPVLASQPGIHAVGAVAEEGPDAR